MNHHVIGFSGAMKPPKKRSRAPVVHYLDNSLIARAVRWARQVLLNARSPL